MRLTSKNTSEEYAENPKTGDVIKAKYDWVDLDNSPTIYYPLTKLLNKLGQLEDIEEEIGIELLILIKALKDGIWTKGGYYTDILEEEPVFVSSPEIGKCSFYDEIDKDYNSLVHDENVMCIYTYDYDFMIRQTRLKDYGKTWALTKEELQDGH